MGASENNLELEIKEIKKEQFNKNRLAKNLDKDAKLSIIKFRLFEKLSKSKFKFNLKKKFIYSLSIFGFVFFLGFLLFFISQSKTNNSKITIKPIVLEKGF